MRWGHSNNAHITSSQLLNAFETASKKDGAYTFYVAVAILKPTHPVVPTVLHLSTYYCTTTSRDHAVGTVPQKVTTPHNWHKSPQKPNKQE